MNKEDFASLPHLPPSPPPPPPPSLPPSLPSPSLPPPPPSPSPSPLIQGLLLGRIWCHFAQSSRTVLPPWQLISQVFCSKKIIGLSQGNITQDKQPLLPRWRGKTVVCTVRAHVGKVDTCDRRRGGGGEE